MTTPGGKQNMVIINESGLYSLILSSKLPAARAFKRWVTSEVLPAIRKHGEYTAPKVSQKRLARSTARHALSARHSRRPVWRRSLLPLP